MMEKIEHLESHVRTNQSQFNELQDTINSKEQTDSIQRNELNFWNGKVQNMRRDLEMQQTFNQKVLSENRDLKSDFDEIKRTLQVT